MFNPNAYDKLLERGFIHSCTHAEELKHAMAAGPVTFYLGIDPTADNLHIGHYFGLRIFKILQDFGHRGILLVGNATAAVGDPSFKNEMRQMLSKKQLDHNTREIKSVLTRFVAPNTKIVFNADWSYPAEIAKHFTIARMLAHECYKNRVNDELTLFELNYMTMQAYDFVHLQTKMGVTLQIGGSDQWANITAGVDLGRRMAFAEGAPRPQMFGLVYPLLTKSDGTKMGKTEKGALWLSPDKTSVYDFYQYFINAADTDVEKLLTYFTDTPIAEIKASCTSDIMAAKREMAFAITALIHGSDTASVARATSEQLFSSRTHESENTPTETLGLPVGTNIVDILAATSLCKSKREARELITGGAIAVDNTRVTDPAFIPSSSAFLLKKGKKTFLKIKLQ
jgi:tyrosyl-tRNA synthetase